MRSGGTAPGKVRSLARGNVAPAPARASVIRVGRESTRS
jgi:hypothetical protein